ncbi:hypothetical protein TBLA_0B09980 [Henningerozyma blattae CBS 6284]|uniref:Ras GEF n=1 Tax=Henningerozyma blattae (strain ATCC 34711 / CBS 6284 / DSM 70876 / NBRC 10599 / NRRL Y-10934 / UCD 77-7) TaxID=1071380 RepID=I2H0B4_HENB6|nr:hypothetical protein TBLA_0B09980 [Tetrapisispora blattae CBS 6284]CCH59816.1 hypothetical protein TBLA_0B09980 [Tetrapisispora blattae CBS 6284]
MDIPVRPIDTVVAIYPYTPNLLISNESNHSSHKYQNLLTLNQGDIIYVLQKNSNGWWDGVIVDISKDGSTTGKDLHISEELVNKTKVRRGWFPHNFCCSKRIYYRYLSNTNNSSGNIQTQSKRQRSIGNIYPLPPTSAMTSSKRDSVTSPFSSQRNSTSSNVNLSSHLSNNNSIVTPSISNAPSANTSRTPSANVSRTPSIHSSSSSSLLAVQNTTTSNSNKKAGNTTPSVSVLSLNELKILLFKRNFNTKDIQKLIWIPLPVKNDKEKIIYYNKLLDLYVDTLPLLDLQLNTTPIFNNTPPTNPVTLNNIEQPIPDILPKKSHSTNSIPSTGNYNTPTTIKEQEHLQTQNQTQQLTSLSPRLINSSALYSNNNNNNNNNNNITSTPFSNKYSHLPNAVKPTTANLNNNKNHLSPSLNSNSSSLPITSLQHYSTNSQEFYNHPNDLQNWSQLREIVLKYLKLSHESFSENDSQNFNKFFDLTISYCTYTQLAYHLLITTSRHHHCHSQNIISPNVQLHNDDSNSNTLFDLSKSQHHMPSLLDSNPNININLSPKNDSKQNSNLDTGIISDEMSSKNNDNHNHNHFDDADDANTIVETPRNSISNQNIKDTKQQLSTSRKQSVIHNNIKILLKQIMVVLSKISINTSLYFTLVTKRLDCADINSFKDIEPDSLVLIIQEDFKSFIKIINILHQILRNSIQSYSTSLPQLFPRFLKNSFNGGSWNNPFHYSYNDKLNASTSDNTQNILVENENEDLNTHERPLTSEALLSHVASNTTSHLPPTPPSSTTTNTINPLRTRNLKRSGDSYSDIKFQQPSSNNNSSLNPMRPSHSSSSLSSDNPNISNLDARISDTIKDRDNKDGNTTSNSVTTTNSKVKELFPLNNDTLQIIRKRASQINDKVYGAYGEHINVIDAPKSRKRDLEINLKAYDEFNANISILEVIENLNLSTFINLTNLIKNDNLWNANTSQRKPSVATSTASSSSSTAFHSNQTGQKNRQKQNKLNFSNKKQRNVRSRIPFKRLSLDERYRQSNKKLQEFTDADEFLGQDIQEDYDSSSSNKSSGSRHQISTQNYHHHHHHHHHSQHPHNHNKHHHSHNDDNVNENENENLELDDMEEENESNTEKDGLKNSNEHNFIGVDNNYIQIDDETEEFLRHSLNSISSLLTDFFDVKQVFHDIVIKLIMCAQNSTLDDPFVFNAMKTNSPVNFYEPSYSKLNSNRTNEVFDTSAVNIYKTLVSQDVEINGINFLNTSDELRRACEEYAEISNIACVYVEQLIESKQNLLNYAARMMKNELILLLLKDETDTKWYSMDDEQDEDRDFFPNIKRSGDMVPHEEEELNYKQLEMSRNMINYSLADADEPWYLKNDHEHELVFDNKGRIKGGSRESLIEYLTNHKFSDIRFNQIFLTTFRSMFTTKNFLYALIYRYNLYPPEGLSYDEYNIWVSRKLSPIKYSVVNIMRIFFTRYWSSTYYDPCLNAILSFAVLAKNEGIEGSAELYKIVNYIVSSSQFLDSSKDNDGEDSISISKTKSPLQQTSNDDNKTTISSSSSSSNSKMSKKFESVDANENTNKKNKVTANFTKNDHDFSKMATLVNANCINVRASDNKHFDITPIVYATELTIMQQELYLRIGPNECLDRVWGSKTVDFGGSMNITHFITSANNLTNFVSYSIVSNSSEKKRANMIQYFISVAYHCKLLNNFSSMTAIVSALYSSPIYRLKKSWALVPEETKNSLRALNSLMDSKRNFIVYRDMIRSVNDVACVPFFGVFLSDLTFTATGNSDILKGTQDTINFGKRARIFDILEKINTFKKVKYRLKSVPDVNAFIESSLTDVPHIDKQYELSLSVEPRNETTNIENVAGERNTEKHASLLKFSRKKQSSKLFW